MEVSALTYPTGVARHARSPLIRLQSDEHLIKLIRAGHDAAFELLVSRYESRLLAFCRHLMGSREDAEDVLQDVFSAAYKAIHADERAINVRPWLYRIARNRCLNQLRRAQAIGVDSMDVLLSANGETTADKVHQREEFRLLIGDIHGLPESQRTALILRELDALSYEQIAEAMETSIPSVKSLLVRARVSLAEAAESRLLSCAEVRTELAEIAEGLVKRQNPLVRRHLKSCDRCATFNKQMKRTNRALAGLMPVGPLAAWKCGLLAHLPGQASGGAAAAGSSAAGTGYLGAGMGAMATKAAAGLALAAVLAAAGMSSGGSNHLPRGVHSKLAPTVRGGSHPAFGPRPATHGHRTSAGARRGAGAHRPAVTATALTDTRLAGTANPAHHAISPDLSSTTAVASVNAAHPSRSPAPASSSDSGSGSGRSTSPGSGSTGDAPGSALVGAAGGTAEVSSGAISAVATVATALGSSLGGSGQGGAGSSSGTQPTVTIPGLTPPTSGAGSTQPPSGVGTVTTPALATPPSR